MIPIPHTNRRLLPLGILGATLLFAAVQATAATLIVPANPTSFEQIQEQVQPTTGKIAQFLDKEAQCGGWNTTERVSPSAPGENGKIAKVTGVPGRQGNMLGNSRSGLASRVETGGAANNGFLFPDTTVGFSTACKPMVRDERNGNRVRKIETWTGNIRWVDYPVFEDPPCKWRFDFGSASSGATGSSSSGRNGPYSGTGAPAIGGGATGDLSPQSCNQFCSQLNDPAFTWMDCKEAFIDPLSGMIICAKYAPKWTCTDEWVGETSWANCRICKGEECRCEGKYIPFGARKAPNDKCVYTPPALGTKWGDKPRMPGQLSYMPYGSFFRSYNAQSIRDKLTEVPKDLLASITNAGKVAPIQLPVACYGFYREFDTKWTPLQAKDYRCVINFPFDKNTLKESQKGRATYKQTGTTDLPRTNRDPAYVDDENHLWYRNLSDTLSLLSEKGFEKKVKNDLNSALLNLDTTSIVAANQKTPAQPLARTSTVRAFDDSVFTDPDPAPPAVPSDYGNTRQLTRWWQELETQATRLLSAPTVRLKLPATSALTGKLAEAVETNPAVAAAKAGDPRMKSIDVQVKAEDDLLGQVAAYLQDSLLLSIEEEPVPVVVPQLSGVELRALRERWCAWALQTAYIKNPPKEGDAGKTCDDVATPEVKAFLQKLDDYAAGAESLRALRSELPQYIGGIVSHQQAVLLEVSTWVKNNLEAYKAFLKNRDVRLGLKTKWREVQAEYARLHDDTNEPWCRNDRYTTPVYSLLPQAPVFLAGSPSCFPGRGLPMVCPPADDKDFVLDLSTLKLLKNSVKLPVLKPVQLRLAFPTPPPAGQDLTADDIASLRLPSLPPVPSLKGIVLQKMPDVQTVSKPKTMPAPSPITPAQMSQMWESMENARALLERMNTLADEFWKSLEPSDATRGLKCANWNDATCKHVEMDLLERITRMVARPGILLQEDLAVPGISRTVATNGNEKLATCDPNDQACQQLLPETTFPSSSRRAQQPAARATHCSTSSARRCASKPSATTASCAPARPREDRRPSRSSTSPPNCTPYSRCRSRWICGRCLLVLLLLPNDAAYPRSGRPTDKR